MASIRRQTIEGFLEALGARSPAPGGGATACLAGALACAQAQMVVEYSLGKKRLGDHQQMLGSARERLGTARAILLQLADEDAEAFGLLSELRGLDEGDERRVRELPGAAMLCADAPMNALAACADAARIMAELDGRSNEHLASDLAIARILIRAAGEGCFHNVLVNLPQLDAAEAERRREQAAELLGSLARALGPGGEDG